MTDGNKLVDNNDNRPESKKRIEDLSHEDLETQIKDYKRKIAKCMILSFSALVAFVFICIAWFASNDKTNAVIGGVSADSQTKFQLASVGDRHETEIQHYWKQDKDTPTLSEGQELSITSYYDVENKEKIEKENGAAVTAYEGSNGLAWRLSNKNMALEPGAFGKIVFYIIPKLDGLDTMKISIKMQAYKAQTETEDESNNTDNETQDIAPYAQALPIDDIDLNNLLYGHVLMFRHLDTKDGYSDRIEINDNNETDAAGLCYNFELKASEYDTSGSTGVKAQFEKDLPYKISIYWIWPKYFRNYVFKNRVMHGDLFTDNTSDNDYNSLNAFIISQKKTIGNNTGNKLFYADTSSNDSVSIEGDIDSNMSTKLLNICSDYYNQADAYIGHMADFLYIEATVD